MDDIKEKRDTAIRPVSRSDFKKWRVAYLPKWASRHGGSSGFVWSPLRKIIFRTSYTEPLHRSSSSSTKSVLHRGCAAYICVTGAHTCWWNVGARLYMDHLLTTYSRHERDSSGMSVGGREYNGWNLPIDENEIISMSHFPIFYWDLIFRTHSIIFFYVTSTNLNYYY